MCVPKELSARVLSGQHFTESLQRRGIEFLSRPPCRKPFPIGDKVTFSGKECVCQTCSQSMTSSKPIKIRGPSRESSPLGASLFTALCPRAPPSQQR